MNKRQPEKYVTILFHGKESKKMPDCPGNRYAAMVLCREYRSRGHDARAVIVEEVFDEEIHEESVS